MRVVRDFRRMGQHDEVTVQMALEEFRETVEWLELVDPNDQATHEWRAELDRIAPPARGCTGDPVTCPTCSVGDGCMT